MKSHQINMLIYNFFFNGKEPVSNILDCFRKHDEEELSGDLSAQIYKYKNATIIKKNNITETKISSNNFKASNTKYYNSINTECNNLEREINSFFQNKDSNTIYRFNNENECYFHIINRKI